MLVVSKKTELIIHNHVGHMYVCIYIYTHIFVGLHVHFFNATMFGEEFVFRVQSRIPQQLGFGAQDSYVGLIVYRLSGPPTL